MRTLIVEATYSSCREDFDENGWQNFLKPNTLEAIKARLNNRECFTLLCEEGGELAGLITIKLYEKIDQLFVHPEHRRKGVARKLWQEARRICEERTGPENFWVRSSSMGVPVYKSFGFEVVGVRRNQDGISYVPMVLALKAGVDKAKRAPVILEEYDADWPVKFRLEKQHLTSLIGRWLYGSIEHIGSTAVPGLVAKPVIDVMFGVRSLDDSKPAIDVLTGNGYEYWPYKNDVMHWFCKPSDAFRTHHLHLVPFESPLWHERLRFRNLLLSDPRLAGEYARLKKELARRYKHDREAYTDEKWPFIKQVLEEAAQQDNTGSWRAVE